jgi:hypothetical protein
MPATPVSLSMSTRATAKISQYTDVLRGRAVNNIRHSHVRREQVARAKNPHESRKNQQRAP